MKFRYLVAALLSSAAQSPLHAQEATPAAPEEQVDPGEEGEELDGPEIVVTGQRERGAVIGDIAPEIQLNRRDIRAYGASNIAELLDALAPQTSSGRGRGEGRPIVLLNGKRISGFREIRDIPPEAIQRVDILPEEVALKYGYRADQRVVNIVLRRRFGALTSEIEYGTATAGGRSNYEADINYLRITRDGRWSLDAEYEHQGGLFESERDVIQPEAGRTLLPETDQVEITGTLNRTIFNDVSATLNTSFDANDSKGGLGLSTNLLKALERDTSTRTGHVGLALNGDIAPWRWSLTANYDRSSNISRTDADLLTIAVDRGKAITDTANAELVTNGNLISLPAGNVSTTLKLGGEAVGFRSETLRRGVEREAELSRRRANFQANVDVPIASRRREVLAPIGDLSANFNVAVDHLSDFGTLRTVGYGLNWSPIGEVELIASVTDEDGEPTVQQLGDPELLTPNVRVLDFVTGETVDITRLTGGNASLVADNRRVFKLGVTVKPLSEVNLSLTANYTDTRIKNPIASFPTATPEIEAAFPERFQRNASGRLLQIDSRPVNFERSDREELRWGMNFTKSIGPEPPSRGERRRERQGATEGVEVRDAARGDRPMPASPPQGGAAPQTAPEAERGGEGWRGGRGLGGLGGGRFGGGGRGGRIQLALYHIWRLEDKVLIRQGVPELDFLNGSAAGNNGGRPRHELEFQAGLFKNGLGARINANWQSGTEVTGLAAALGEASGNLRFSSLATVNLRLFADLGQQRALVTKHPWLRGTRISLNVDNLFDSRLRVTDAAGTTPLSYQADYLNPLGRAVTLSIRKLTF